MPRAYSVDRAVDALAMVNDSRQRRRSSLGDGHGGEGRDPSVMLQLQVSAAWWCGRFVVSEREVDGSMLI